MGGLKGQPIHSAAYTVVNQLEEIRGHSMTLTKSMAFVQDMLKGIETGLKANNHPPTELFYTDQPQRK